MQRRVLSVTEALREITRRRIDLVITNYALPDQPGANCLEALQKVKPTSLACSIRCLKTATNFSSPRPACAGYMLKRTPTYRIFRSHCRNNRATDPRSHCAKHSRILPATHRGDAFRSIRLDMAEAHAPRTRNPRPPRPRAISPRKSRIRWASASGCARSREEHLRETRCPRARTEAVVSSCKP